MNRQLAVAALITTVTISALIQVSLKKAAIKKRTNEYQFFLNSRVIINYIFYFCILFINVLFYKYVEMNEIHIIESISYIFVPIFSFVLLKEKINRVQLLGFTMIIIGIVVYSI